MRWPDEIEDDLLAYRSLDIGHWHRLTIDLETGGPKLSSRRLLVILDGLPDRSRYKTARRGGRQTRPERVAEMHYNETSLLRASYHSVNGGEDAVYEPFLLIDPVDEQEQAERDATEMQEQERAVADFETALGWS